MIRLKWKERKNEGIKGNVLREKYRSSHPKKKTSAKRRYFLVAVVVIILIIAAVYVLTRPSPPSRYVRVELVDPLGAIYNSTLHELRFSLNFTPSDNNLVLSRIVYTDFSIEKSYQERIENGTVLEFVLNYAWTPYPGEVTALDLYFSDANSNVEVVKTEVRIKMPQG